MYLKIHFKEKGMCALDVITVTKNITSLNYNTDELPNRYNKNRLKKYETNR